MECVLNRMNLINRNVYMKMLCIQMGDAYPLMVAKTQSLAKGFFNILQNAIFRPLTLIETHHQMIVFIGYRTLIHLLCIENLNHRRLSII